MRGQLFTSDFIREGIRETVGWNGAEAPFIDFRKRIVEIFVAVPASSDLNEAQTEDDVIVPVLKALGWGEYTRQQTAGRLPAEPRRSCLSHRARTGRGSAGMAATAPRN
jgi:hypothetical protein